MDAQWPLTQPVKRGTCGLLLGDDDARLRVDVGLDRPLLDGRVHFRHRRRSYVSRTSRCGSAGVPRYAFPIPGAGAPFINNVRGHYI